MESNIKIPTIKKKISSYVLGEEGKISKQSLITLGAVLGTAAVGGVLLGKNVAAQTVTHTNSLSLSYSSGLATGTHSHHASHASY